MQAAAGHATRCWCLQSNAQLNKLCDTSRGEGYWALPAMVVVLWLQAVEFNLRRLRLVLV